jgi:hypothetical protein
MASKRSSRISRCIRSSNDLSCRFGEQNCGFAIYHFGVKKVQDEGFSEEWCLRDQGVGLYQQGFGLYQGLGFTARGIGFV